MLEQEEKFISEVTNILKREIPTEMIRKERERSVHRRGESVFKSALMYVFLFQRKIN